MRILKVFEGRGYGGVYFCVAGATIRVRILKEKRSKLNPRNNLRCRGYDPGEDTERYLERPNAYPMAKVAGATIRVRILKGTNAWERSQALKIVAGATIRVRILKEDHPVRGDLFPRRLQGLRSG